MIQRIVRVLRRTGLFYLERQIPRSSAAMAYYLTMSLFPLIVCLYALLGRSYQQMIQVLELADRVLQPSTTQYLKSFLLYVANNPSKTMVAAAILLLLSSASAAVRVLRQGLREIRGQG
jgi:membrane protein